MANVSERIFSLINETVQQQGVDLWDIRFVKEGATWYLRIFIDKADGISIDDCTNVSHAIDPIIEEADPIDMPYYLEVCSPGIERELTRPEHFKKMEGKNIHIKTFKAIEGSKDFSGVLKCSDADTITINTLNKEKIFNKKEISKVCLCDL